MVETLNLRGRQLVGVLLSLGLALAAAPAWADEDSSDAPGLQAVDPGSLPVTRRDLVKGVLWTTMGLTAAGALGAGLSALGFHLEAEKVQDRYETATVDNLKGRPRNNCPGLTVTACTVNFLRERAESHYSSRNTAIATFAVLAPLAIASGLAATWIYPEKEVALAPTASSEGMGVSLALEF